MNNITIGYLSWKRHDIFEQTLSSHMNNGLFDIIKSENRLIFFQEISKTDINIARKYDCKCIGNNMNIGILNAFIKLVEECKTDYFIFCENDWLLIEDNNVVNKTLEDCIYLLQNNKTDLIKLRHIKNPGNPLYSRPSNVDDWIKQDVSKFSYKLESLSWIEEPNKIYDNILTESKGNYLWYTTTLDHQWWSNNVFIANVSYLKNILLPLIKTFIDNNDKYLGLEEILINYKSHLGRNNELDKIIKLYSNTKLSAGNGLFTHKDYTINAKVNCFRHHFYECEKIVKKYITYFEDADILDIGSNVGFYSEAIIKNTNYKSIHLFEPCKEYFEHSISLLKDYKNLYFNNFGLCDTNNELILYKSSGSNIGWNTFLDKDPNQNINFTNNMIKEICSVKKLDDYKIDNVDFIKIDVEGFEYKVLEGGFNLISKYKPYILIEVGWGTNHPDWEQCEKQYNKLFDIGYKKVEFKNITQDILFEPI